MTIKNKVIDTILESMEKNGRPSTSGKAIEKLIDCLEEASLLVSKPTDAQYANVESQIYSLISTDITQYGKASSNSLGAQRAYNLLSEAGLIAGE